MVDVGERDDRRPGRHDFAELGLAHQNDAVERRRQRRIAEDDLGHLERGARAFDIGDAERDVPVGGSLERLVAFERGFRLFGGRLCDVASVDCAGALGEKRLGAIEFEPLQRDVRFVADDGPPSRVDVLLRDVELLRLSCSGSP